MFPISIFHGKGARKVNRQRCRSLPCAPIIVYHRNAFASLLILKQFDDFYFMRTTFISTKRTSPYVWSIRSKWTSEIFPSFPIT